MVSASLTMRIASGTSRFMAANAWSKSLGSRTPSACTTMPSACAPVSEARQMLRVGFRAAALDHQIPAQLVTVLGKPAYERGRLGTIFANRCPGAEQSDAVDLLGGNHARPRDCRAEQRHEIPPPHSILLRRLRLLDPARVAARSTVACASNGDQRRATAAPEVGSGGWSPGRVAECVR